MLIQVRSSIVQSSFVNSKAKKITFQYEAVLFLSKKKQATFHDEKPPVFNFQTLSGNDSSTLQLS